MERYYIVKCDLTYLKKMLLEKLGNHKFVSKIFFRNIFNGVVLETVSTEEMDYIYNQLVDDRSIIPAPNNTCNAD